MVVEALVLEERQVRRLLEALLYDLLLEPLERVVAIHLYHDGRASRIELGLKQTLHDLAIPPEGVIQVAEDDVEALKQLVQEDFELLLAHEFNVSLLGGAHRPVPFMRVGSYLLQESILVLQSLLDDVVFVGEFSGVVLLLLHLVSQVLYSIAHLLLNDVAGEHLVLEDLQVLVD